MSGSSWCNRAMTPIQLRNCRSDGWSQPGFKDFAVCSALKSGTSSTLTSDCLCLKLWNSPPQRGCLAPGFRPPPRHGEEQWARCREMPPCLALIEAFLCSQRPTPNVGSVDAAGSVETLPPHYRSLETLLPPWAPHPMVKIESGVVHLALWKNCPATNHPDLANPADQPKSARTESLRETNPCLPRRVPLKRLGLSAEW